MKTALADELVVDELLLDDVDELFLDELFCCWVRCSDELEEHSCAGHLVELFLDELAELLVVELPIFFSLLILLL